MNLTITTSSHRVPLKYPFTISRYTVNEQETVIVAISNGTITGYGEATVNPYYQSTSAKIINSINSVKSIVENGFGFHPEELWQKLEPALKDDYFALCGIDCAYWDFYSRLNHKPMRSFWSGSSFGVPQTSYTIGIDSVESMKVKILDKPWPIYKIKLGITRDLEIVQELRNITNAIFRIDANCAWGVEEAIQNSKILKELGVEFIEQPLQADNWEGMKILKEKSALPIIADESCQKLEDVQKCAEFFDGINIKLMKCGGITPALKMIQKARALNLKIMAGCMTESSIGISNLVQLAPLLDYIDADGAILLATDIASGVQFQNGKIIFPDGFGSGAKLLQLTPKTN
ncbi:dipeptide epimerase [Tamlana flava]|uniref:dipeptide epimerase n=1 Tax=Tamlana flava TaxID=3158572 RepID=UPI00351B430B